MKRSFVLFSVLVFSVVVNCSAQDKKSSNEETPSVDTLIKNRAQTITTFYILLNQEEEVSTNEMSKILDLENEWAFVDSTLSPTQQKSYYDADWDSNSSPIMARLRGMRDKLQLGKLANNGKTPMFSIRPDLNNVNTIIAAFVTKGKSMDITFEFYSHPFDKIKAIFLPNGKNALELIKGSSE